MTKQLLVLRHAKSSWDDPGLEDYARPLAARGQRAVTALGAYLRRNQIEPSLVLCSGARRARETLEGVAPGGKWTIEPELYGASAAELRDRLRRVPDVAPSVMLIGHNPAMQMLVLSLLGDERDKDPRAAAIAHKYPTGALARLELDGQWSSTGSGDARLLDFVRPRDLE